MVLMMMMTKKLSDKRGGVILSVTPSGPLEVLPMTGGSESFRV